MELSLSPSPAYLAGLRQAVRVCLRGVASQAAEDVVLALNEAATNAILYGSGGAGRSRWWSRQRRSDRGVGA
jgi:anti-sigma regulatory factor (Ser/Thr protein kinase)